MKSKEKWSVQTQKALNFVQEQVSIAIETKHYRLPSTKALANSAGVSVFTMHKAIEILQKRHIISASPRRGIYVNNNSVNDLLPKDNDNQTKREPFHLEPKWKTVKSSILEGILNGTFPPGSVLPSKKELCLRYGTGYAALSSAINELIQEKKIVVHKKGYKVREISILTNNGTIIAITPHEDLYYLSGFATFFDDFFINFERQQRTHNFRMDFISYARIIPDARHGTRNKIRIDEIENSKSVIGYIILNIGIPKNTLLQLFDIINNSNKPLLLLNIDPIEPLHNEAHKYRHLRILELGTNHISPGISVGNYLFLHGHKKVAYFAYDNVTGWCCRRGEGIAKAYNGEGGNDEHVHCFYKNIGEHTAVLIPDTPQIDIAYPYEPSSAEKLYFQRKYTDPIEKLFHHKYNQKMWDTLFEKALKIPGVTAWVGVDDEAACYAYFYLLRNNIRIPEDIALISFDNTYESFAYGISSYDFNIGSAINETLRFLFTRSSTRLEENIHYLELPGMIIERTSTNINRTITL